MTTKTKTMTSGAAQTMVRIGWRDAVLLSDVDLALEDAILRSEAMVRARRHLAVERGGRRALSAAHSLIRQLVRLARLAAEQGAYLDLETTNQTTAPASWSDDGLGILVRAVTRDNQRILWEMAVTSDRPMALPRYRPAVVEYVQRTSRTPARVAVRLAAAGFERSICAEYA